MKIISIVGARPNFIKIAPFIHEINRRKNKSAHKIQHILVHTGQHYDDKMSQVFFESLQIPQADINLGIGSGTHAEQVGQTMIAFEKVLIKENPDWVVVVGDVNATLACSVTAKKHHVKVCHIEAGLRSGDEEMPEEINRLVTDRISDLLLTPDNFSTQNLLNEGVEKNKIEFVGNIMIDTLEKNRCIAGKLGVDKIINKNLIDNQNYAQINSQFGLMTLHRPSNVDDTKILKRIVDFIISIASEELPIIWTLHPRTQKQLQQFGLLEEVLAHKQLVLLHPLCYHEMLCLNMDAIIMLTDSGGLQEECTVLSTPCLTLRGNTERPITLIEHGGASVLVGNNIERIRKEYKKILVENIHPKRPEFWDGKTAERIVDILLSKLEIYH